MSTQQTSATGPAAWRLGERCAVSLDRSAVIAILNVTPDSFSDGGELPDAAAVATRAQLLVDEGAAVLDIGGESTRPGATRVPAEEQIRRVVPSVRAVRDAGVTLPISVDTTLTAVAEAALDAGADAINDVSAGADSDDGTLRLAAERGCGLVLMHRLKPPEEDVFSDRYVCAPDYSEGEVAFAEAGAVGPLPPVVSAVLAFLQERHERALSLGVPPGAVAIDPGLGFGKSVDQNLALLRYAGVFAAGGVPVFAGASRKSFVGAVTGVSGAVDIGRLPGSLAAAASLHAGRVRLIRVHDVLVHTRLLAMLDAIDRAGWAPGGGWGGSSE